MNPIWCNIFHRRHWRWTKWYGKGNKKDLICKLCGRQWTITITGIRRA